MRGVNQSERSFIYSMNEREPAMNGNQLARICREARYIFNWPSDGSTATPMAQLSSTTLIEDSLFSPVKHRHFNVTCVSDATGIAHYWQKTCPKALWSTNDY
jgi:hypothetical protein